MTVLMVPPLDEVPWPSLGKGICDLIEERAVFGPGSLKGLPAVLDAEKRAAIYRAYEVYPKGHPFAGRRRFKRVGLSWRKGTAKTEFAAWIAFVELHPEAPVRCDGFDGKGNPVGVPVRDPYIPMLAYTEEQVTELTFGALFVVVTEGADADLFDAQQDRIIRLDMSGRKDGEARPLAGSPNARDGARTTFQTFDEPHRLYLPKQIAAHETMSGNLPKRALEDPWSLYVSTAGEPGQGSVQETLHGEAESIGRGEIEDPQLFFFHREAGPGHDMDTLEGRIEAVKEATGPIGEYGPGQFRDIARQWERPGADKSYLERTWLNRWIKSNAQAFDLKRWEELRSDEPIPEGAFVAAGFDGARFRDSTGIVLTDIATGKQQLFAGWERPADVEVWEIPEDEVTQAWVEITRRFNLWKCYGDPPHWTETFGSWAAKWPDQFVEWWTNRPGQMSRAVREYREAQATGAVTHYFVEDDEDCAAFERHIGAAGRSDLRFLDDDGTKLFILKKIHEDRKFDYAMAGCLSWKAYLEAIKSGANAPRKPMAIRRIR